MDETIRFRLELDGRSFADTINVAKDSVGELKDSLQAVSEVGVNAAGELSAEAIASNPLLEQQSLYTNILSGAEKALTHYNTAITKVSSSLQMMFGQQMKLLAVQVQTMNAEIANSINKAHISTDDIAQFNNKMRVRAAAIETTTEYMNAMRGASKNAILTHSAIEPSIPYLSHLVQTMVEGSVKDSRTGMSLTMAASAVANDKRFISAIESRTGKEYADTVLYDAARALIAANPKNRVNLTEGRANLSKMTFKNVPAFFDNVDALPKSLQDIYFTKGHREGKVSRGKYAFADQDLYKQLIKLTDSGENSQLIDFAQRAGLMRLGKDHKMRWRERATMDQFDTVAALAAASLYKTRLGSPLYPRDPLDNESVSTTVRALSDIISVVGKQQGLNAGILAKPAVYGSWTTQNTKNKNILRTLRNPDLYVIPQTEIDDSGKLVFRDPLRAARTHERARLGLGDREEDPFVAINESAFTYLLGYRNKDNNTFGTGVDESGRPTYRNTPILKIKTTDLVPTDDYNFPIDQKGHPTERMKHLSQMIKNGARYANPGSETDAKDYVYGWVGSGGKGAYFVEKNKYNEVVNVFDALGIPNPFAAFNERGLVVEGDKEKTTKQINNVRKGATPGVRLVEYGFDPTKIGTIDYSLLDAAFSAATGQALDKEAAIDGLAYLAEHAAPTSIQGRLFAGAAKFMGQRMSLRDLIGLSGAVKARNINGPNQLIQANKNNKYGFSYYMPSLAMENLGEEEAVRIIRGLIAGSEPEFQGESAKRLLNKYFTDVMSDYDVLLTDSAVKNVDQFRQLSEKHFKIMFPGQKPGTIDKNTGLVKLNRAQQEYYMSLAAKHTGGLWAAKTNDDFLTEKDVMPITAAQAINLPPSLVRRSHEIYEALRANLQDEGWLYDYFVSNPRYKSKIEQDKAWLRSDEARGHIKELRDTLDVDEYKNHKLRIDMSSYSALAQMMPGSGVERSFQLNDLAVDRGSKVAPLFPSLMQNYFSPDQLELARRRGMIVNGKLDPRRVVYSPGHQYGESVGGRMPASPGTYANLLNVAYNSDGSKNKRFLNAFAAIGSNDKDMVTLTPEGIFRMNTGDFDGDTVWLYAVLADEMLESLETMNSGIDEVKKVRAKRDAAIKAANGNKLSTKAKQLVINTRDFGREAKENSLEEAVVGTIIGSQAAQLTMGGAAAGIRNLIAYGDLSDAETKKALLALVEFYDKGTSEVLNKGEQAQIENLKAKQFMMAGRTLNRLMQQVGMEESGGERKIDNIFKYRGISPSSSMDVAMAAALGSTRFATGEDFGIRRSLLKAVDRRYAPDTAAHKAAEWYANYIADQETGYKFYSKEEFAKAAGAHIAALRAENTPEADEMIKYLTKRASEYEKGEVLSRDILEDMRANNKDDAMRQFATNMLAHQASKTEAEMTEEELKNFNEDRKFFQEVRRKQAQNEVFGEIDAVKTGRIQDTRDLRNFITSFSVTAVEPWMEGETAYAKLLSHIQNADVVDLKKNPFKIDENAAPLTQPKYFGDVSEQVRRQARELELKSFETPDTVLGTFMHAGLEDFFKENAEAIAAGTFTYETGKLTQLYREKLLGNTKDENGNLISWDNLFRRNGIDIRDITGAFKGNGLTVGRSVTSLGSAFAEKVNNVFGINRDFLTEDWDDPNAVAGIPELMLMSLLGSGGEWVADKDPSRRMKRVIMTENTIFDKNGKSVDISGIADSYPLKLPELGFTKFIHAKPDLVYEDQNGRFNIMDYKSSEDGAMSALYQNLIYVKILEDLAKAAHEGKWADGSALDESVSELLAPYKQFMEVGANGELISKFNGGKAQALNLLGGKTISVDITDQAIGDVYEEYFKAARKKAADLQNGYISGKKYLQELGVFSGLDAFKETEEGIQIITGAKKFEAKEGETDEERARRERERDFLIAQFQEDKNKIPELNQTLYKYQKRYGLIGERDSINQFSWMQKLLDDTLTPDMFSALYAAYDGSPEIQKLISDVKGGKDSARQALTAIIRNAALQDPELAIKSINEIAYGKGQTSSALASMQAMDRTVKTAIGSREALKTKDAWDGSKWLTEPKLIAITDTLTPEEKEKYEKQNNREIIRANEAQRNKDLYEDAQYSIDRLLIRQSELIPEVAQREVEQDKDELKKLIGKDDPYTKVQDAIRHREDKLKDWILAKKSKAEELAESLNEKTGGQYKITGKEREALENEANELKERIRDAEAFLKSGQGSQEVIDELKRKYNLTAESPKERADKWYNERKAVLEADAEQARLKWLRGEGLYADYTRLAKEDPKFKAIHDAIVDVYSDVEAQQTADLLRSSRDVLTPEEQVKRAITRRKQAALKYLMNNPNAPEAEELLSKYNDKAFWENELKYELGKTEDANALAAQRRQADFFAAEVRGNAQLRQMGYSSEDFKRQMRRRYTNSRIFQSMFGLEDRKRGLERQIQGWTDSRKIAEEYQKANDLAVEQYKKEHEGQDLSKDSNYQALLAKQKQSAMQIAQYDNQISQATSEIDELSITGAKLGAVFGTAEQALGRLARRLGRQLFYKALNETKRFVKEFDASMNEIQAITLKSRDEMQTVRSDAIDRAIKLRTSVSNIATTEAALYRQGLSDEDVKQRTESIIKFATVTKLNVGEATKIITTALQNDLVPSAEAAMDALVALGDSAATTAAEIGKGMQKAAASAKVAGVSYAELTALLTIGTSDTQLSGTQVGTALQTIFTRMRRLSLTGYVADQNGQKTTASDAEAALKAVGVDLWDDKVRGKMRSAYDILYDLAKVWEMLSDAQKSIVTNALSGTRQTNIFSTLMEGMSEDGGETLKKYLGLAEGSAGITQSKYEIAMQSLQAAIDEVRSSWDAIVETFTNNGLITGVLDKVSDFLQGLANIGERGGNVGLVLSGIAGGLTAIFAAIQLFSTGTVPGFVIKILSLLFGLAAGGVGLGITGGLVSLFNPKTEDELLAEEKESELQKISNANDYRENRISETKRLIENVKKLGETWETDKSATNREALIDGLKEIADVFPEVSRSIKNAIEDLNGWESALDDASKAADEYLETSRKQTTYQFVNRLGEKADQEYAAYAKKVSESSYRQQYDALYSALYDNRPWGRDASAMMKADILRNVVAEGGTAGEFIINEMQRRSEIGGVSPYTLYSLKDGKYSIKNDNNEALAQLYDELYATAIANSSAFSYSSEAMLPFVRRYDKALENNELPISDKDKANALIGSMQGRGNEFKDVVESIITTVPLTYFGLSRQDQLYDVTRGAWLYEDTNEYNYAYARLYDILAALLNVADTGPEGLAAGWAEDALAGMPLAAYATEYTEDFIRNALIAEIVEKINNHSPEFWNEDGTFNANSVPEYVLGTLERWDNDPSAVVEEVAANVPSDVLYYIVEGLESQVFENADAAQTAIDEHNKGKGQANKIGYTAIKAVRSNEETQVYQSAQSHIDAALEQAKQSGTAATYNEFLANLNAVSSMAGLLEKYDETAIGSVLATVFQNNATLLGAYAMVQNGQMSFEEFKDTANNMDVGRTLGSEIVTVIMEQIKKGTLDVKTFRTSGEYSGVYELFKSLVGDSVDTVLNAIEDGVSDPDALRQFNSAVIALRVKEAMQFSRYYTEALNYATTMLTGTETEKAQAFATQQTEAQKFADYSAALDRYLSGETRSEDYQKIAEYTGLYTETQLRNGEISSEKLTNDRSNRQAELEAGATADLSALFASAGISLDAYGNLDRTLSAAERKALAAKISGAIENDSEFSDVFMSLEGLTYRDIAESKMPGFSDALQLIESESPYEISVEDGNIALRLKPLTETQLTKEAVNASYDEASKGLRDIYAQIVRSEGDISVLSAQDYERIMDEDETFRAMKQTGAGWRDFLLYAQAKSKGADLGYYDTWNWLLSSLWGEGSPAKWNLTTARGKYTSPSTSEAERAAIAAMAQAGPAGMYDYIINGTGNEQEIIKSAAEKYYQEVTYANLAQEERQRYAQNRSVMEYGTAEQQQAVLSDYSSQIESVQNALFQLGTLGTENAQYGAIASLLGEDENKIKEMSKEALNNAVKEKQDKLLKELTAIFGFSFDVDGLVGFKSKIQNMADESTGLVKEFLEAILKAVDLESIGLNAESTYETFGSVLLNIQHSDIETRSAMAAAKAVIESGNYSGLSENKLADWSMLDQGLLYMMADRAKGNATFSDEMIMTAYNNALYGRKSSPETQQAILNSLFGNNMSAENMIATYQGWKENPVAYAAQLAAYESLDNTEALTEAMTSEEDAVDKTTDALKEYNKQVGPQQAKYLKQYGDYTDDAAASMLSISSGGKTAVREIARIKSSVLGLQDTITAIGKARGAGGKSLDDETKSVIASYLGVDEKTIEKYTAQELDRILDRMESAVNEEFTQSTFQPVLTRAFEDINSAIDTGVITFDQVVDVVTSINDTGDMSAFIELLRSINSDYADVAESMSGDLLTYLITVLETRDGNGGRIDVKSSVEKSSGLLKGGTSYNKSSGGGGKSATDKLIEAQKHRIDAIQHENNMLEIDTDSYARANNVEMYEAGVDKQIAGQEKLRAAYQQNINELKRQMQYVKQGSSDWWKLVDALAAAEEAYAKIDAAISDLIRKQIQEQEELYNFNTSMLSHERNMLDVWRQRYGRYNDYSAMNQNIDEQVANAYAQQAEDIAFANYLSDQIQELYDNGDNSSDSVRELQQKLNEMVEKIAQSTETIAELEASRLSIIQQERQNSLVTPQHISQMLDYEQQIFGLDNNYSGRLDLYGRQNANLQAERAIYEASRAQALELLSGQEKGTQGWYDVRSELYAIDEELKRIELAELQLVNDVEALQIEAWTMEWNNAAENRQHNLNMIQTQQGYYQTKNELTNYGIMLEAEADIHRANIEATQDELEQLEEYRAELEATGRTGTDNYKTVIDLIREHEEALLSENAALEENSQKQKENAEAILKTKQALEEVVDKELRSREEERKKQLSATVSMENTLLETIKDRYKAEWDLIRQDIDKKKEALNKEKSLISERLNARKAAASAEEKYSELEEYQRQLSLIANDPTRTKDAKVLREKIRNLQKELSWQEASDEANASIESINDEINALTDYETTGSENLNEMLADANNFTDEIELIMQGGWESISSFLMANNETFKNSLDDAQQQMLEGWEQTWKSMNGIADTYWEEIEGILTSLESFTAFMMASSDYLNQSATGQELMRTEWEDIYNKYLSATKRTAEWTNHEHDLGQNTGTAEDVETYEEYGYPADLQIPENQVWLPVDNGKQTPDEEPTPTPSSSGGSGSSSKTSGTYKVQIPGMGVLTVEAASPLDAIEKTVSMAWAGRPVLVNNKEYIRAGWHVAAQPEIYFASEEKAEDYRFANANTAWNSYHMNEDDEDLYREYLRWSKSPISKYQDGGLVDYTGLAWVDGTPSAPEAFLNATDTKTLRKLADALTFVSVNSGIWPNISAFGTGSTSFGNINVTINQAELKDDADFDDVARRVGKALTKEMSKKGYNMTGYNM